MSLKSLHHRGHAAAAEQSPADSPWWELTLRQPYLKGTSAFIAHSHFPQHTISRPQLFLYVFWPVSRVSLWWQKASTQSVLEVNIYCKLLCVRVCVCVQLLRWWPAGREEGNKNSIQSRYKNYMPVILLLPYKQTNSTQPWTHTVHFPLPLLYGGLKIHRETYWTFNKEASYCGQLWLAFDLASGLSTG